jgi:hypothetical protein
MTQIILDSAQARVALRAHGEVQVVDPDGNLLGVFSPATNCRHDGSAFSDAEIAAAIRSRDEPGPRYTTQEVLEHLRALRPETE